MEDYKENYNKYWKNIVENEDGSLNKDCVMRELSDYSMIIDYLSRAYDAMTEGDISNPSTHINEVLKIFYKKYRSVSVFDIYGCSEDLVDIFNNYNTVSELKKKLYEYLK